MNINSLPPELHNIIISKVNTTDLHSLLLVNKEISQIVKSTPLHAMIAEREKTLQSWVGYFVTQINQPSHRLSFLISKIALFFLSLLFSKLTVEKEFKKQNHMFKEFCNLNLIEDSNYNCNFEIQIKLIKKYYKNHLCNREIAERFEKGRTLMFQLFANHKVIQPKYDIQTESSDIIGMGSLSYYSLREIVLQKPTSILALPNTFPIGRVLSDTYSVNRISVRIDQPYNPFIAFTFIYLQGFVITERDPNGTVLFHHMFTQNHAVKKLCGWSYHKYLNTDLSKPICTKLLVNRYGDIVDDSLYKKLIEMLKTDIESFNPY